MRATIDGPKPDVDDWQFHQATGMVAAQIGIDDMDEAASRLVALAVARHESIHDTARAVINRTAHVK